MTANSPLVARIAKQCRVAYADLPKEISIFIDALLQTGACFLLIVAIEGLVAASHLQDWFVKPLTSMKMIAFGWVLIGSLIKALVDLGLLEKWVMTMVRFIVSVGAIIVSMFFVVLVVDNAWDAASSQMKVFPLLLSSIGNAYKSRVEVPDWRRQNQHDEVVSPRATLPKPSYFLSRTSRNQTSNTMASHS